MRGKVGKKRTHSAYSNKETSLARLRKLRTESTPSQILPQNSPKTLTPVGECDSKLATDATIMCELDSDHIDHAQAILWQKFKIGGLQDSILGSCIKGTSMPKFKAEESCFVQILNVGDHWVCVTNNFSNNYNDVYIYDSLFSNINPSVIVQTTSLLRTQEDSDIISFHMRKFAKQNVMSRLCGFYAVAAAISVCNDIDPSGIEYDESVLVEGVRNFIRSKDATTITGVTLNKQQPSHILKRNKRHCMCHSVTSGIMIQCSFCSSWFHEKCVEPSSDALTIESKLWMGPCCSNYSEKQLTTRVTHRV